MIKKIKTLTHFGLSCLEVIAEANITNGKSIFSLVGMAEKSIIESRDRLRVVIEELGKIDRKIRFPLGRITVNLAPAEVVKRGNQYDLAILLSMISCMGYLDDNKTKNCIFLGELALDGSIKRINNMVNYCLYAREHYQDHKIFIPFDNMLEASFLTLGNIYAINHVQEIIEELLHPGTLTPITKNISQIVSNKVSDCTDFSLIKGQEVAKKAMIISATGGHNLLMIGEAGSGKTLLARTMQDLLPDLSESELMEVAKVRSLSGLKSEQILDPKRPFRSPHHSASTVSLLGGGKKIEPGEVTKAHYGVLFLDELSEFDRKTIDSLRQPLEDSVITIARASGVVTYPCNFQLLATMNPSFGGDFENDQNLKKNSTVKKISGPILDRIDLQIRIFRPTTDQILAKTISYTTLEAKNKINQAYKIQIERQGTVNANLTIAQINQFCALESKTEKLIKQFIQVKNISMRSYHKILKVARTIADLKGKQDIEMEDLSEALSYR
jgi:magnesium chelatase family protein